MPEMGKYDNEKDWMAACVPMKMDEGMENDQAVAVCLSQWREKKSLGDMQTEGTHDEGNSADGQEVAFLGDAVKALDDKGKVGGYLVRFSTEADPDLTGDFFTSETDFGETDKLPVLYHHGFDKSIGKRKIGAATLRRDDVGIWAEAQLQLRDQYEQKVFELAKSGKLGWSSGAASHTVEREEKKQAAWVKQWYLAEASLTPTPAEYRNQVVSVKALAQGAGARDEAETVEQVQNNKGVIKMELTKEELAELVASASADAAEKAVKKLADELPEVKTGFATETKIEVVKDEADQPFESLAQQLEAVKTFASSYGQQYDPRLKSLAIKAPLGLNEGIPAQGGFLLSPTISAEFLKPIHEEGVFSRLVRRLPVGGNSNSGWINGIDETSRVNGSRWGGVQAYWRAEAGTVTATKPKFRRVNWELNALEALMYITDEQLQDAAMTAAIARESAAEELMFKVNDAILSGDGVGKPLGVLNSGALISATRTNANDILFADILGMWQRLHPAHRANSYWFVNSEAEPKLDQLYLTTSLESRYVTYGTDGVMRIKGRPVIVTEFNPGLGAVGDILLADMTDYLMWEKGGVQSSINPWIQWLTSEQAFKFTLRVDGKPATYSALTPYKGTNTQSPYVALAAST